MTTADLARLEASPLATAALAALAIAASRPAMAWLRRRSGDCWVIGVSLGLQDLGRGLAFGAGAAVGAAAIIALWGGAGLAQGSGSTGALAAWFVALGFTALAEERVFRGLLLPLLAGRLGWPGSAALGGLAFAALHLGRAHESLAGLAGVFAFSLVASAAAARFGSLAWPVGFHAAWDWMQDLVLGLPDAGQPPDASILRLRLAGPDWLTGGGAGPEGSLAVLAALLLMAAALAAPRRVGTPGDR